MSFDAWCRYKTCKKQGPRHLRSEADCTYNKLKQMKVLGLGKKIKRVGSLPEDRY